MVLVVFCVTASASADDAADAQAMFAAGVAALEQNDANAARVAFERSLELHPTSAAAFNLAGVLTDLAQPAAACSLYEELGRGVYGTLTSSQAGEVER
ncbi:MAG: Tfp pilus assembly protein PilF, partial [Polyangiales bacterium]